MRVHRTPGRAASVRLRMKDWAVPFMLMAAFAVPAAAQRAAAPSGSAATCAPINRIFIDNHSIFDPTDPEASGGFGWIQRTANALHFRTDRDVVRRELIFHVGECLDPFKLEESERLLRRLGFLSRVDIFAVPEPDSGVHVIVDTQDEWSTQVNLSVGWRDGPRFEGAELRELNLFGSGRSVGVFYRERGIQQSYGVKYAAPQLLGTRWDLRLEAGRTRAGKFVSETVAYPFVGESGTWAALQHFTTRDIFFDYILPGLEERHVLLPLKDESFDLGTVRRIGRPGRLWLVGGAAGIQRLSYPGGRDAIELALGEDFSERDTAEAALIAPVTGQMHPLRNLRIYALVGRRAVHWVQRRGLDALRGEQDVRLGTQVTLAFGRSLPISHRDDDLFSSLTLFGSTERGRILGTGRLRLDARHDLDAPRDVDGWEDVAAAFELLGYWRPEQLWRQTFLVRASGTGGWNTRTPFQLTLGGRRGVRGYSLERFPGGRRLVFTLEDRIYFGWPYPDILDLGATVFADFGRIWPGDVPFGTESGWRASAGFGLRGSFPAGGRTTYRIDVAAPVDGGLSWKNVRLLVSVGEYIGLLADPVNPQLARSRMDGASRALFHFPD